MYTLLGGDIREIDKESDLERLQDKTEEVVVREVKKKGRPKKTMKKLMNSSKKCTERLENIRFSLEDCRTLCDLLKRREKYTDRLIEVRNDLFFGRLQSISQEYPFKRPLSSGDWVEKNKSIGKNSKRKIIIIM